MIEQLFGSKTRANTLRIFFREPEKPFFVRELARALDAQINAARREIDLLQKVNIIKEVPVPPDADMDGAGASRRKYYALNPDAFLYDELKALLMRAQLMDEQALVHEISDKGGKLILFILTGRFTGDKRAPIDMLMVGDVKESLITKIVSKYEKKFGFDVRYTLMSEQEFYERRHMMDKFVYSIFECDLIKVVDKVGL